MLLDNFKPLLYFGGSGTFVNVAGTTVNVSDILSSIGASSVVNSHTYNGVGRSFDYTATPGSNSYTNEQTTYNWDGVVVFSGQATNPNGFTLFVGSGSTAVTASDYCLDSALNLDVTGAMCKTSSTGIVTISRTFENNTGSDVSVRECGLYIFTSSASAKPVVMVGRKVFGSAITIPNGEQRTFEYIIHMEDITFTEQN